MQQNLTDLWRSVESGLNVLVEGLVGHARRAKVNDLDFSGVNAFEEHVLWLQVTVNYSVHPQHSQRLQDLQGKGWRPYTRGTAVMPYA